MRRCRYYVNTSFVIDLMEGHRAAVAFARRAKGELCSSKLLLVEFKGTGRVAAVKETLREYRVTVLRVSPRRMLDEALETLTRMGLREPSDNTIFDTAHILTARLYSLTFVTADDAACNRAIRLGVECINYRTGEHRAPP